MQGVMTMRAAIAKTKITGNGSLTLRTSSGMTMMEGVEGHSSDHDYQQATYQ
jgi:hypothetical protein